MGDPGIEPMLCELVGAEGPREEAALIMVWLQFDDESAAQRCLSESHNAMLGQTRNLAATIPPEVIPIDLLSA